MNSETKVVNHWLIMGVQLARLFSDDTEILTGLVVSVIGLLPTDGLVLIITDILVFVYQSFSCV